MYEIVIKDNITLKIWTELYNSYFIFRKRFIKLKHSTKLNVISHSNLVD